MPNAKTPVVGVCGWKKSGKTTLTVRLIEEFTRRGHHVVSIKHAHHEFQVDDGPTDSARHRTAGSREICIVGGKRWAIIHQLDNEPEPNIDEVLGWMSPADIIIVEGYKSAAIPKVEVRASTAFSQAKLTPDDTNVIAIATDKDEPGETIPVLSRDDVSEIADLIVATIGPIGKRIAEARALARSRPAPGKSDGAASKAIGSADGGPPASNSSN
ncbi:MAG: molybdopterin-guanine dinucleotide biosynthesis protein B [Hyphomicrobium aestuarii]|nr:molybdopterin-guanine dinucleotide biosynthesis protein B [Hyphomicrobium aestuarii]